MILTVEHLLTSTSHLIYNSLPKRNTINTIDIRNYRSSEHLFPLSYCSDNVRFPDISLQWKLIHQQQRKVQGT